MLYFIPPRDLFHVVDGSKEKPFGLVGEKKENYKIPQAKLRSRIAPIRANQVNAVILSMSQYPHESNTADPRLLLSVRASK